VARLDADYLGWIRGLDDTRREVAEAIEAAITGARDAASGG